MMEGASFSLILVSNITKMHNEPVNLHLWLELRREHNQNYLCNFQIKLCSPFIFWFVHKDFIV